jgi:hypothetical protein
MGSLQDQVEEYANQLKEGHIQKAYRGIMTFMSEVKAYLEGKYPDYDTSTLYHGYLDMTYFAFTSSYFKSAKLKIAIVYLHEECRFEAWLAGHNRRIQADYIKLLSREDLGNYRLSRMVPGVDSIVEAALVTQPDFDNLDGLKKQIEHESVQFAKDMESILKAMDMASLTVNRI